MIGGRGESAFGEVGAGFGSSMAASVGGLELGGGEGDAVIGGKDSGDAW